jgi:hypothetical protein
MSASGPAADAGRRRRRRPRAGCCAGHLRALDNWLRGAGAPRQKSPGLCLSQAGGQRRRCRASAAGTRLKRPNQREPLTPLTGRLGVVSRCVVASEGSLAQPACAHLGVAPPIRTPSRTCPSACLCQVPEQPGGPRASLTLSGGAGALHVQRGMKCCYVGGSTGPGCRGRREQGVRGHSWVGPRAAEDGGCPALLAKTADGAGGPRQLPSRMTNAGKAWRRGVEAVQAGPGGESFGRVC